MASTLGPADAKKSSSPNLAFSSSTQTSGPQVELPSSFRLGKKNVPSFLKPVEIRAHLLLMGAFSRLRDEVSASYDGDGQPSSEAVKWAVFVKRAVHRFHLWWAALARLRETTQRTDEIGADELPPLDVLMIFHAYCLAPRTFYIDLFTTPPLFRSLSTFPLLLISHFISSDFVYSPTEAQRSTFTTLTATVPELPLSTTLFDRTAVPCPVCSNACSVPWITLPELKSSRERERDADGLPKSGGWKGKGRAQESMVARCEKCSFAFGREEMRVKKLLLDCERVLGPGGSGEGEGPCFPGFVLGTTTGYPLTNFSHVRRISVLIARHLTSTLPVPLSPTLGFSSRRSSNAGALQKLKALYSEGLPRFRELAERFMRTEKELGVGYRKIMGRWFWSRYESEDPGSLDLVGAVLRQGSFIETCRSLGWLDRGWDRDGALVAKSIGRYHGFLELMTTNPLSLLVPTLDIDLSWHTHQLNFGRYREQVLLSQGTFVDHDDRIEEGYLHNGFSNTESLWVARFGVPYTQCGCQPNTAPAPKTPVLSLFKRDKAKEHRDGHQGTHPSDHPSIRLYGNPKADSERARREDERHVLERYETASSTQTPSSTSMKRWGSSTSSSSSPPPSPTQLSSPTFSSIASTSPPSCPPLSAPASSLPPCFDKDVFFRPSGFAPYFGISRYSSDDEELARTGRLVVGEGVAERELVAWGFGEECSPHSRDGLAMDIGSCAAGNGTAPGNGLYCGGNGSGACATDSYSMPLHLVSGAFMS